MNILVFKQSLLHPPEMSLKLNLELEFSFDENIFDLTYAHKACPISWQATSILLFPSVIVVPSIPIKMRSIESSISQIVIFSLPLRPARMAALFISLAKSAPLNPGVLMAITLSETLLYSVLFALCTFNISSLPFTSGNPTVTCK